MTCYSYIYDEIISKLRVPTLARESLWNRMKKHFNFLNKHIKPIDILADADVPIWGYITSPMLILQAEIDDRLALDHYDKLLESHNKNQSIEAHLISDLTHAGARINTNRDNLIKNWLTNRVKSFFLIHLCLISSEFSHIFNFIEFINNFFTKKSF